MYIDISGTHKKEKKCLDILTLTGYNGMLRCVSLLDFRGSIYAVLQAEPLIQILQETRSDTLMFFLSLYFKIEAYN